MRDAGACGEGFAFVAIGLAIAAADRIVFTGADCRCFPAFACRVSDSAAGAVRIDAGEAIGAGKARNSAAHFPRLSDADVRNGRFSFRRGGGYMREGAARNEGQRKGKKGESHGGLRCSGEPATRAVPWQER